MDARKALIEVLKRAYKRSAKAQQRVEQRYSQGKCLGQFEVVDEAGETAIVDCENARGPRLGLCPACHYVFDRDRKQGSDDEQLAFVQDKVSKGLVLSPGEGVELSRKKSLLRRKRA